MSAPDTQVQKQVRRHWGPIYGIGFGLTVVAILFIAFVTYSWDDPAPTPAEAVVEGIAAE